jgi:hypothetical protein
MIFSKNSKIQLGREILGNSLGDKERGFYVDKYQDTSENCMKTTALAMTALKTYSKCSFITYKLRFFANFCLVLAALATFSNNFYAL